VQHVEPDHLEVEAHLEVPRLEQLEDPLVRLLGRTAQRSRRGGELRALSKVHHSRWRTAYHAPEEGVEVEQLVGAQHALLERGPLGVPSQVVPFPFEPAVAAGIAPLVVSVSGVGGHRARHTWAWAKAVGEGAAEGREFQVVASAARERHVQVALGLDIVEHRDVGEQMVTFLLLVDEEEPARGHLAVQKDRPVGE